VALTALISIRSFPANSGLLNSEIGHSRSVKVFRGLGRSGVRQQQSDWFDVAATRMSSSIRYALPVEIHRVDLKHVGVGCQHFGPGKQLEYVPEPIAV
jgi:hypothetical protein